MESGLLAMGMNPEEMSGTSRAGRRDSAEAAGLSSICGDGETAMDDLEREKRLLSKTERLLENLEARRSRLLGRIAELEEKPPLQIVCRQTKWDIASR
jgi:hypothetical protein